MLPFFIVLIGYLVLRSDAPGPFDYVGIILMIASGFLVTTRSFENSRWEAQDHQFLSDDRGNSHGARHRRYYEGLKRLKAAQVSVLELTTPFFASAIAYLTLGRP